MGLGREIGAFVVVVVAASCCLFGLFSPLTLAEADPWATAVLVDEVDAGGFESAPDNILDRVTRLTGNYPGPNCRLGFAALQCLLKRHANKALIGNPFFFRPAAHSV